jgi:hypothetical protein
MEDLIKENLADLEAFLLDIEILDQLESELNVFTYLKHWIFIEQRSGIVMLLLG